MRYKVFLTYDVGPTDVEKKTLSEVDAELIKPHWETEQDLINIGNDEDLVALLVGPGVPITKRVINAIPNLRIISRLGIGVDNIDLKAATARGIPVSIVTDYCIDEVSDHAMAFILSFARRILALNQTVKAKRWTKEVSDIPKIRSPMFRLKETTLGIVGAGQIGKTLINKAKAFGMRVIIYDPYLSSIFAEKNGVELVDFPRLLSESDFVSIHAPLNQETKNLFNIEAFQKMKRTSYLVNNARGGILDEKALFTAIKEGYIAGAGLDVMEIEPPDINNPLFNFDNVIITGHSSWYSETSVAELREKAISAVVDFLRGNWPRVLANPEVKR